MSTSTTAASATSLTNNERPYIVPKRKTTSYRKESKNATAVTQVTAWLKAVNVTVKPSTVPGCDLVALTTDGREVEIKVGVTSADARPAVDHLFVLSRELTN